MNISCLRVILWNKEKQLLGICQQKGRSYVDFMGIVLDKIDTLEDNDRTPSPDIITVKEVGHLNENTVKFEVCDVASKSRVEILRSMYSQLS